MAHSAKPAPSVKEQTETMSYPGLSRRNPAPKSSPRTKDVKTIFTDFASI